MDFFMENSSYPASPRILKGKSEHHQTSLPEQDPYFDDLLVGNSLLCINCLAPITSLDLKISVNDSHTHVFINPAGLTFRIGCFSSAHGCRIHGDLTSLHSWFKGYSWNFADCATCHDHLGWQFIGQELAGKVNS